MGQHHKRHGCLTALLIVIIAANAILALVYLLASGSGFAAWVLPTLAIGCLANVACAVALFRWKKWGFWGFAATSAAAFVINLSIGVNAGSALVGFAGIAVLYGVLQIGDERSKGWSQLT
jgi:hypothetical protein